MILFIRKLIQLDIYNVLCYHLIILTFNNYNRKISIMVIKSKEYEEQERKLAMEKYLAEGGKITKLGSDERSEEADFNPWKRRKPKSKD